MSKPKKVEFSQREIGVEKGEKPEFGTKRHVLCASVVGAMGLGAIVFLSGCRSTRDAQQSSPDTVPQAPAACEKTECYPLLDRFLQGLPVPDSTVELEKLNGSPIVLDLLEKLSGPHEDTINPPEAGTTLHQRTIIALGFIGDNRAVPILLDSLSDHSNDPSWTGYWNFIYAIEALGRIGDPRAVGPLLAIILDPTSETRTKNSVIEALGSLRDPRAVPHLIAMLTNFNDVNCQSYGDPASSCTTPGLLIDALGNIGDARALPLLIDMLDEQPDAVFDASAKIEGSTPLLIEALISKLSDPNEDIASPARDYLVRIGSSAVPALLQKLSDPNIRMDVAHILGAIKDTRAVQPLIEMLLDPDEKMLVVVVNVLGIIGDSRAIQPLISRLSDKHEDESVRSAAAYALGNFRESNAKSALFESLWERTPTGIYFNAAMALWLIGDPAVTERVMEKLSDSVPWIRMRAASVLGLLKDFQTTPKIIELIPNADYEFKCSLISALGELGDPSAVPILFELMDDTASSSVAITAYSSLSRLQDPRIVPGLIQRLSSPDPKLRFYAADCLGKRKASEAVPALMERLSDENARVRAAAVEALGWIGDARALLPLRERLSDRNHDVRILADCAIERINATEHPPWEDANFIGCNMRTLP